jgi:hypothetical protein
VVIGAVHLFRATSPALEEHYRKHWGDENGRYQLFVGAALLLLGINSLAAAAAFPIWAYHECTGNQCEQSPRFFTQFMRRP